MVCKSVCSSCLSCVCFLSPVARQSFSANELISSAYLKLVSTAFICGLFALVRSFGVHVCCFSLSSFSFFCAIGFLAAKACHSPSSTHDSDHFDYSLFINKWTFLPLRLDPELLPDTNVVILTSING